MSAKFTCATHLRGRIGAPRYRTKRVGRWRTQKVCDHYWFEVYNERTGKVLLRSDAFGIEDAIEKCSEAVAIARGALFWSLRRKDLL